MSRLEARRAALIAWAPAMAALVAWLLSAQHAVPPARWAAGLLLAFVVPGMAATAALFFGRPLSTMERVVLAPALSLATLVLGGLLLDALGLRLTAGSWGGLTAVATVVLAGVGYLRWLRATRGSRTVMVEAVPDDDAGRFAPATNRQLVLKLGSLVLAAALLGGASWVALHSATNQSQAGFTALSMVHADDANQTDTLRPVTLAVFSHETVSTQYFLRLSGAQSVLNQFTISLQPGEVWQTVVQVPFGEKVTADLFKGVSTTPYRSVYVSGLQ
jgi:uncharacterized membrane protein